MASAAKQKDTDMDGNTKIALGLEEAATALSIGNTLMRRLVAEGEIPSIKVSGRTLVPVKALEAYALGKLDPALLAMCARVDDAINAQAVR